MENYFRIMRLKQIQFRKYCQKKENKIIDLPIIKQNNNVEAVLIETRILYHLPFIIKNAIKKLGSDVSLTVVCGNSNEQYIREIKKDINRDIKIINLGIDNLTREEYSIMLLNSNFWKRFQGEKLLIFQEDTIIFKKLHPKFLEYDYIGAPLEDYSIGNGGLSLRSKSIMIKICENFFDSEKHKLERAVKFLQKHKDKLKEKNINLYCSPNLAYLYKVEEFILEDCRITEMMRKYQIGKLPSFQIGREFSIEKFNHPNPFGGHAFWHTIPKFEKWLDYNLKY